MPAPPVILNNTPLVALWSLDRLDLLGEMFGIVWIPPAVAIEFLAVERALRQHALHSTSWLETVPLADPRHALTYTGLDRGEAEVLALAVEHNARLVIIDERNGRHYARRLGLPLTGTLGVLLLAKEKGAITSLAPLIGQLQDAGLYLAPHLVKNVLRLAGELE